MSGATLIIDLSYVVFYRYHAACNWFKMSQQPTMPNHSNILEDVMFMEMFDKRFKACINKLVKDYAASRILFAADSPKATLWRTALHPEYKAHRTYSNFDPSIFIHVMGKLIPDMCKCLHRARCVRVEGAEADDVIAVATRFYEAESPGSRVVIVSADKDFLQLINQNTKVINLTGKDLVGLGDAKIDLMMKIISGDKSDNIRPIISRFAKGQAIMLATNPLDLDVFLTEHPDAKIAFDRNRKLIDMNCIPLNVANNILAAGISI
jgi:5'-3' exonuclease